MSNQLTIKKMRVEYMENPLGLDCPNPRFSWRLCSPVRDSIQKSWRILVKKEDDDTLCWDSGEISERASTEIVYDGIELQPCTSYVWTAQVNDTSDNFAHDTARFETGFMDITENSWSGARWLSTPETPLESTTKGIFAIECALKIDEGGTSAGIVFGADDNRLASPYKNIYCLGGENYIAYELDVSQIPAKLVIYRVGYHPQDQKDIPFATTFVKSICDENILPINESNRHTYHTLRIEVLGNQAKTYVDGICVDAVQEQNGSEDEPIYRGRQLNPLAINDTLTFPRLNKIGFSAGKGTKAFFKRLSVHDIRTPKAVLFEATAYNSAVFDGVDKEDNAFVITGDHARKITVKDPAHGAIPMLRTVFNVGKTSKIKKARLYVTARGVFEEWVNGARLCENYFQPDASQFDKRLYYKTFDIGSTLSAGKNTVAFYLASGWWSDAQTFTLSNYNYFGHKPSLLAKIVLLYENGETQTIVTDTKNWKSCAEGPVRYAGFFNGEHYDARLAKQYEHFSTAAYNDSHWKEPAQISPFPIPHNEQFPMWPAPNHSNPAITGHYGSPVKVTNTTTAITFTQTRPGIYTYDMGSNMAGVPHIKLQGNPGDKITLRYAEVLYPNTEEYKDLGGIIVSENLRDADCTDIYICAGDAAGEWYSPRFTFHGYRYIEITGLAAPLPVCDVKIKTLSSMGDNTADFECSDALVNTLYQNIRRSQNANFISIPTDCPQRNERMGWMGDAQVFVQTATYNDANTRLLFYRFLEAARDLQAEDGRYPNIAPFGGGFGGIAWECAGIVIPWQLYRQFGDLTVIRDNYEAMKKYLSYLQRHTENGILHNVGLLGDWLATDTSTDNDLIWNAIGIHCFDCMSKMAAAIGNTADSKQFRIVYTQMKQAWNARFIDSSSGKTKTINGVINDTQCSYALPLYYDVIGEEFAQKACGHLNRKTKELGYTLTTGFLGTGLICPALTQGGYSKTAYLLLCQTNYPSWLYSVTQGATSIWERWNSFTIENGFGGNNSMNSFNHYSLGAVGAWLIHSVLGIQPLENSAGYLDFAIRPQIEHFSHAKGYFISPHGKIECSWKKGETGCQINITIPANTTARLLLPSGLLTVKTENAAANNSQYNKYTTLLLGSGAHNFHFIPS